MTVSAVRRQPRPSPPCRTCGERLDAVIDIRAQLHKPSQEQCIIAQTHCIECAAEILFGAVGAPTPLGHDTGGGDRVIRSGKLVT